MKCELCHNAEAASVLNLKRNGVDCELYVCRECASEHKKKRIAETEPAKRAGKPRSFRPAAASQGDVRRMDGKTAVRQCPGCGRRAAGPDDPALAVVGCEQCYETFRDWLRERLRVAQFGDRNCCPPPKKSKRDVVMGRMHDALRKLVEEENFEEAEELKRQIEECERLFGKDGGS